MDARQTESCAAPPASNGAAAAARVVQALAAAVAVAFMLTYLGIALLRLGYPFDLEWMEGGSVDHVVRVLAGKALYVEPTLEFVPYLYTPLYYYVAAAAAKIVGIGFTPLRLVSLLASVACFWLIYRMTVAETRQRVAGLVAAGLYAATFNAAGAWFDLARVDSLFMALLLGGIYLLRRCPSRRGAIVAGALLVLAFLTKQLAVTIALPVLAGAVLLRWRTALWAAGTFVVGVGAAIVIGHLASDGWFSYYLFAVAWHHPFEPTWVTFWTKDLLGTLPVAVGIVVASLIAEARAPDRRRDVLFHAALLLGALGTSYAARLHGGGYSNVLMPAYAALCLGLGRAAGFVTDPARAFVHPWARAALYLACLVQLAMCAYDPRPQVPTAADLRAGRAWEQQLAATPGDVWVPYHGYIATRIGKRQFAHAMAVGDLVRGEQRMFIALTVAKDRALRQHRFAAIYLDAEGFLPSVDQHYVFRGRVFRDKTVFQVKTGKKGRPEFLYLPPARPEPQR